MRGNVVFFYVFFFGWSETRFKIGMLYRAFFFLFPFGSTSTPVSVLSIDINTIFQVFNFRLASFPSKRPNCENIFNTERYTFLRFRVNKYSSYLAHPCVPIFIF